jgi:hypothetical protein
MVELSRRRGAVSIAGIRTEITPESTEVVCVLRVHPKNKQLRRRIGAAHRLARTHDGYGDQKHDEEQQFRQGTDATA